MVMGEIWRKTVCQGGQDAHVLCVPTAHSPDSGPHSPACGFRGKHHSGFSIEKLIRLKTEVSFSGVTSSIMRVRYKLFSLFLDIILK